MKRYSPDESPFIRRTHSERRRAGIRLTQRDHEAVEKVRARYEQPRPPVQVGDIVYYKRPQSGVNWATVFALVFAGGLAGWWLGAVIEGFWGMVK